MNTQQIGLSAAAGVYTLGVILGKSFGWWASLGLIYFVFLVVRAK